MKANIEQQYASTLPPIYVYLPRPPSIWNELAACLMTVSFIDRWLIYGQFDSKVVVVDKSFPFYYDPLPIQIPRYSITPKMKLTKSSTATVRFRSRQGGLQPRRKAALSMTPSSQKGNGIDRWFEGKK